MTDSLTLLYCPFPDLASARMAATALLDAQLVACCNLLPGMESHYDWEGARTVANETVLLAKTLETNASQAVARIQALHPYETPAVLRIGATANAAFVQWVTQAVTSAK